MDPVSTLLRWSPSVLVAALVLASTGALAWTVQPVGSLPYYATDSAVADGDRDGQREVYVSDWQGFTEFEANGTGWIKSRVQTGEGLYSFALAVGDGDRDGQGEVYLGGSNSVNAPQVRRFAWNGSVWAQSTVMTWASGGYVPTMTVGDVEADGLRELYVGVSINLTGTVHKVWFKDGAWHRQQVAKVGTAYPLASWIGDGDRDGKPELYVGTSEGKVFEIGRNATSWTNRAIATLAGAVEGVAVGDADSDGKQEVYAVALNKVYRLTVNGTAFQKVVLAIAGTSDLTDLTLGDTDGDGKAELYVTSWDGHAYRIGWTGTAWATTDLGDGAQGGLVTLAVGDGDNDGDREVYVGSDDPMPAGPPSGQVSVLAP